MKITVHLQPSLRLMRLTQQIPAAEGRSRQFHLDKNIMLSECQIDGEEYQINQRSRLQEDHRSYLLPIGAEEVELGYVAGYAQGTSLLLFPEDLWYADPEGQPKDYELIVYPSDAVIVTNLTAAGSRGEALVFRGQDPILCIAGPYHTVRKAGGTFYLLKARATELLDRGMQAAWRYVEAHFGMSRRDYPAVFVEVEELPAHPGRGGIQFLKASSLEDYGDLLQLVAQRIRQHRPIYPQKDVQELIRALYEYMAWRGLSDILSPAESSVYRMSSPHHGPLSEIAITRELGIRFFDDLAQDRGEVQMDLDIQKFFERYEDREIGFVHFYNHFGEAEAYRERLDAWLFQSR